MERDASGKLKSSMGTHGHGRCRSFVRHTPECGEPGPAQVEEAIDLAKEWNELLEGWEGEADPWTDMGMDDDAVLTEELRQNSLPEGERPAEHATGRRWRLPHGCSEPRPRQAQNRIADEVLTISAEAAVENVQIDKAMAVAQKT